MFCSKCGTEFSSGDQFCISCGATAPPPRNPVSQPAVSQPAVSQPAVSQPAVSQPAVSQPAVSQPAVSQPAVSQPAVSPPAFSPPAGPDKRPLIRRPAILITAAVVLVAAVAGGLFLVLGGGSSGYPTAVQSSFLKSCDAGDGGGAGQTSACNCFLMWLEAHVSETKFLTESQNQSTVNSLVVSAESSCPTLRLAGSGSSTGGSTSGGSTSGGSTSGGSTSSSALVNDCISYYKSGVDGFTPTNANTACDCEMKFLTSDSYQSETHNNPFTASQLASGLANAVQQGTAFLAMSDAEEQCGVDQNSGNTGTSSNSPQPRNSGNSGNSGNT